MNNKQNAAKQEIVQLILKWKLSTAEVQLQKDAALLSETDRAELNRLLEQYRGYDRTMFSAQENADKNPGTARMMMNRVPRDILITHPSYRRVSTRLQKNDDDTRIKAAFRKCDDAEHYITSEFSQTKADDALFEPRKCTVRQVYPFRLDV